MWVEEFEDKLEFAGNFYICMLPHLTMTTSDSNSCLHILFLKFIPNFLLFNSNILIFTKFQKVLSILIYLIFINTSFNYI